MKQYFKNTYEALWTVLVGMKITFKHLFKPAVTIQYPDVKVPLRDRVRNRLYVNMDDCIGCDQCSRACPVSCIEIETVKGLPTDDIGVTWKKIAPDNVSTWFSGTSYSTGDIVWYGCKVIGNGGKSGPYS